MPFKYMSLERITEYDGFIKDKINSDVSNALSNANSYTDTKIANLVNSAPETLNTLGELATALHEDADIINVLNSSISNKAEKTDLNSHILDTSNPHKVTLSQLGASIEAWKFTLDDGSIITKEVVVK